MADQVAGKGRAATRGSGNSRASGLGGADSGANELGSTGFGTVVAFRWSAGLEGIGGQPCRLFGKPPELRTGTGVYGLEETQPAQITRFGIIAVSEAVGHGLDHRLSGLMAVVVAPLVEEIVFRGLLQGALSRLFRWRWSATVISAAIFALIHLALRENAAAGEASIYQIEAIPPLFFLGLVMGYSYEKSQSLYRPIWIHMGFNALTMIFWLQSS